MVDLHHLIHLIMRPLYEREGTFIDKDKDSFMGLIAELIHYKNIDQAGQLVFFFFFL